MPKEYKNLTFKNSFFQKTAMETEINKLSAQGWNLKSNDLNKNIFNVVMERDINEEDIKKRQASQSKVNKKILIILGIIFIICFTTINYISSEMKKIDIEQQKAVDEKYKDVKVIFNASDVLLMESTKLSSIFEQPNRLDKKLETGLNKSTNSYSKNGENINITYNSKTNNIISIFIEGTDKEKLIREANLNATRNNFNIEEIANVNDSNKITGIKITKKIDTTIAEACTRGYIKDNAKNSSSIKFISTDVEYMGGDDYYIYGSFNGTNSFGGTVTTNFKCNTNVESACIADCKFN